MCKRVYIIRDEAGGVLEVRQGTAKNVQRYIREEYHANGVKASMEKATRRSLREQEECDD